jgi:hypothetical protein
MRWRGSLGSLLLVVVLTGNARPQPAPPARVEGAKRTTPDAGAGTQITVVTGSAGAGSVTLDPAAPISTPWIC